MPRITTKIIAVMVTILFTITNSYAMSAESAESMRKVGDVLQYANPLVAYAVATQELGGSHFVIHYGQSIGVVGLFQYAGRHLKYDAGMRPYNRAYDGMPSGHTASAWTSAAYVRQYGGKYQFLAIPLYATAAYTATSRVAAKRHTVAQVLAGIALSEGVVYINSRMDWAQTHVTIIDGTIFAGIKIRL